MKKAFLAGLLAVLVSSNAMAASASEYGLLTQLIVFDIANGQNFPVYRPPPNPVLLVNKAYVESRLKYHVHKVVGDYVLDNNASGEESTIALWAYSVEKITFADEVGEQDGKPVFTGTVVIEFLDYTHSLYNLGHYERKSFFTLDFRYWNGVWEMSNFSEEVVCSNIYWQEYGECSKYGDK